MRTKTEIATNSYIQLFPLLRLAVMLILGISVGDWLGVSATPNIWFSCMLIPVLTCIVGRKYVLCQNCVPFLFFFLLGGFLVSWQVQQQSVRWHETPVEASAVIVNTPIVKERVVVCDLRLMEVGHHAVEGHHPLLKAYIHKDKRSCSLRVGEGLLFRSVIGLSDNRRGSHFDFRRYLWVHGFSGTTYLSPDYWQSDRVDVTSLSLLERTKMQFLLWRSKVLSEYASMGVEGQQYAVMAALTLGDKSSLNKATKDAYSHAGASHILALSGLHLGILYTVLMLLFGGRRHRYLSTLVVLLSVWLFVFLVGMSPSVIRSAVMLTVYSFVLLLGRDNMSLNTLSFAALVMLIINPLTLFDVGFQLSFVAVLSILLFYQPLYELFDLRLMQRHQILKWLIQLVTVSIAAQVGTFPLVIYYFGSFPIYFLLTNLIVIPAATLILYLSVLFFVLSFLPFVQQYVAYLLVTLVDWMNASIVYINHLPASTLAQLAPSVMNILLIYLVIFSIYAFLLRHTPARLKFVLLSVLAMSVSYLPVFG